MPDYTKYLKQWPQESHNACERLVKKYGEPDEATPSRFIWYTNGAWKRTELSRDPVPHHWPMRHHDMVESVIDYPVPPDRVGLLAQFDGSVIVDRTKGELLVRCEAEEANFLAINLAHKIVTGQLGIEAAREEYALNMQKKQTEGMGPTMKGFTFDLPKGETRDPDLTTLNEEGHRVRDEGEALETHIHPVTRSTP